MKTRKLQSGYNLVEIMIAMSIGLFLMGGMIQMFITSKKVYKLQDSISRLQENNRFAMDFLVHDMRGVGSWGCFTNTGSVQNLLNTGTVFDNFANGITGTDNHVSTGAGDPILAGTDTLTLNSAAVVQDVNGVDITVQDIPATPSANLKISANSGIVAGDILVVGDCDDASLFQVTNINAAGAGFDNVVHNTGNTQTPGNASQEFVKTYNTDARFYKASFITYSIQTGSSGQPALFRQENAGTPTELIAGVENMQILYGEDTDNDGTPNRYLSAAAANNVNMAEVVSIKVSLLIQSVEDNQTVNPTPYTFNGVATTPADKRIRRIVSQVVSIRNHLI